MKISTIILGILLLCLEVPASGQAPQGINYQAIVRNSLGSPLTNQFVAFKFIIHQGSTTGPNVYIERDTQTTNQFGSVTIVIGQGAPLQGTVFSQINWSTGVYYNEVQMDSSGGSNYTSMGATRLWSVPYALYADEHQTLSLIGNTLSISSGNSVNLPSPSSVAAAFQQTLVIGNRAGINSNTITQAFIGATQETGVNNFLIAATWTVAPVFGDSVTGAYQTDQTHEIMGFPCNNSVLVYGASTYKGNTFYTMNTGCNGTQLLSFPNTSITLQGTYPASGSGLLFSDGNYLYIHSVDSFWMKLSLSGNMLINQGTLTLPGTSQITSSVMCDGTYYYALNSGGLYKYSVSNNVGTVVGQKTVYGSPSGLVNLDTTRLYVLSGSTSPGSPSSVGLAVMTPIGKP